ncbi:MAG: hypothetical protein R2697_18945 [Ilumatobacteraceae bacterium]
MTDAARTWAADVGVEIVDVTATFDEIVVRTAGLDPPVESGALHDVVAPIAPLYGVDPAIVVTFEQRQVIPAATTPTTTTTPPTTTTTTTTTTTPATTAPTIAATPTTSAPATAAP